MQIMGYSAVKIWIILKRPGPISKEQSDSDQAALRRYEVVLEFTQVALGGWMLVNSSSFTGELIAATTIGLAPAMEEIISKISGAVDFITGFPERMITTALQGFGGLGAEVFSALPPTSIVGSPVIMGRAVAAWMATRRVL